MSTPFDWENRPQAFPEPITAEEVAAELLDIGTNLARACNQYVEDVNAEERAETERILRDWGIS